jgi:hypothetical protein
MRYFLFLGTPVRLAKNNRTGNVANNKTASAISFLNPPAIMLQHYVVLQSK